MSHDIQKRMSAFASVSSQRCAALPSNLAFPLHTPHAASGSPQVGRTDCRGQVVPTPLLPALSKQDPTMQHLDASFIAKNTT